MNRLSFKFNTSNNLVNVVIFNRAFLKPNLLIGKYITVIGKYDTKSNTINAADIKLKGAIYRAIEKQSGLFKADTVVEITNTDNRKKWNTQLKE